MEMKNGSPICYNICYMCTLDMVNYVQGVPIKNNPLEKIHYLSYCNRFFFTKFTAFPEDDSRHIHSKFRYNICCGLEITTILT